VTYLAPDPLPHDLFKGIDAAVTQRFLVAADESAPTVTATEVKVYHGSTLIGTYTGAWDAPTATASATVLGAGTSSAALDDVPWYAVWRLTIGGVVVESVRAVRFQARAVYCPATTAEVLLDYPDLESTLGATSSDRIEDLAEAWERLQRELEKRGVKVNRLMDPGQLAEPVKTWAAAIRYMKAGEAGMSQEWKDAGAAYLEQVMSLLERPMLVDEDQSGAVDTLPAEASDQDGFWKRGRLS